MNSIESIGNLKLKAILLLVAIFLAGALAGVGVTRFLGPGRPPFGHGPRGGLKAPLSELGLTAEQDARIKAIFEKYRPELDGIFSEIQPRLDGVRRTMDNEIRGVLTPEQRQKFDALPKRPARPPMFPGAIPPPPP